MFSAQARARQNPLYNETRLIFSIVASVIRNKIMLYTSRRRQVMQHSSIRVQELNPGRLTYLFRKQFEMSKVQKGETIAIVSDLGTRREFIESAFAAADEHGADIYEMCVNSIPGWTKVGVPTIGQVQGHAGGGEGGRSDRDLPRPALHQVAEGGDGRRHPRADDHRRARRSRAADVAARA